MPASSFVSKPTRTFGSVCCGSFRNTCSSVAGLSFAAQPAAFAIAVSFKVSGTVTSRFLLYGCWLGAVCDFKLRYLAQLHRVMVLSHDALGLSADFHCARRDCTLARLGAPA